MAEPTHEAIERIEMVEIENLSLKVQLAQVNLKAMVDAHQAAHAKIVAKYKLQPADHVDTTGNIVRAPVAKLVEASASS